VSASAYPLAQILEPTLAQRVTSEKLAAPLACIEDLEGVWHSVETSDFP